MFDYAFVFLQNLENVFDILLWNFDVNEINYCMHRCWRFFNGGRSGVTESHRETTQAQICDWITSLRARHRTGLHKTGISTASIMQ